MKSLPMLLAVLLVLSPMSFGQSLSLGDAAPALQISKWVKGEAVTLGEATKGKVVVVEFWATWCGPCIESIPHLTELQHTHAEDGLIVIGVTSVDGNNSLAKVEKFVGEWGDRMDYRVAFDEERKTNESYMDASGQMGIPTAFLIDQEGRLAWMGHPRGGLDAALGEVLAGTYDIEAASKMLAIEQRLDDAAQRGDRDAIQKCVEEMCELEPQKARVWVQRIAVEEMLGGAADTRKATLEAALTALAGTPDQLAEFALELASASRTVADNRGLLKGALAKGWASPEKSGRLGMAYATILFAGDEVEAAKGVAAEVLPALEGDAAELATFAELVAGVCHDHEAPERQAAGATVALEAIDAAIAAAPEEPNYLLFRFYVQAALQHDVENAQATGTRAIEALGDSADALNAFTWGLLTDEHYDDHYHELALAGAEALAALPQGSDWIVADTIALAYFENDRIQEAVEIQRKAVESCDNLRAKAELTERLARFRSALEDSTPTKEAPTKETPTEETPDAPASDE